MVQAEERTGNAPLLPPFLAAATRQVLRAGTGVRRRPAMSFEIWSLRVALPLSDSVEVSAPEDAYRASRRVELALRDPQGEDPALQPRDRDAHPFNVKCISSP